MPRWHRTAAVNYKRIPAILGTTRRDVLPDFIQKNTPKLYNAKRRIKYSHGLTGEQYKQWLLSPADIDPFEHISDDVADYIRNNGLETQLQRHAKQDQQDQTDDLYDDEASRPQPRSETLAKLLRNPPQFFSRPYNVPEPQRTQVHFPNFEVAMIRRPKHPPNYATFQVPLWFNKMDMKDYLKSLYDVDVVDVRSFVYQLSKRKQEKDLKRIRKRKLYRPMPLKRMTVQLVDAFEWPKEPEDFSEYVPISSPSPALFPAVTNNACVQMGQRRLLAHHESPPRRLHTEQQEAPQKYHGRSQYRTPPQTLPTSPGRRLGQAKVEANLDTAGQ
jgi:ribosomal protein L23